MRPFFVNKKLEGACLSYTKIQWAIVLIVFLINIIWIKFSSFTIYYSLNDLGIYILFILAFYVPYLFYKKFRPDPKIMLVLQSGCWLLSFTGAAVVLSYLAYSTNRPLITETLANIDSYLGVSPPDIVMWFWSYRWLNILSIIFYFSFLYQKPFILLYFSLREDVKHLQRFIMQYMFTVLLTICIGAYFPAEGTYAWYHFEPYASQWGDLQRLYEVRQNILNLRGLNGIIEFPSLHTALGVIYIYAFRDERKIIFIPIVILNILLFFSCISTGGHFLIDVLAGIAVAVIAIGMEKFLFKEIRNSRKKLCI